MCGIAGFIDYKGATSREQLVAMTDSMTHRGPDGSGYSMWNTNNAVLGFGHRRLSIIDLSEAGAQPMDKHDFSIIFNGEIYNYKEIQIELKNLGYSFRSDSDTEVVLSSFKQWGTDCVNKLRGMFAFSIYDHTQEKVYFFRDRIGVKPLFFYEEDGLILFASELKAFHKHPQFDKEVNLNAVRLYFKYGFVPSPLCIFDKVKKVIPGHFIIHDLKTQKSELKEYWNASSFVSAKNKHKVDEQELEDEIEALLKKSFEYRMVADVPVGVFLSGGYDSSLVTAVLQCDRTEKINTFTIGFEDKQFNEANYATEVANYLGTNHTSYTCTKKEAQEIIPEIPFFYDEPFADSSAIPTFLVSKITAQSVKVALSADGGDELFSGYNRNLRFLSIKNKVAKVPGPIRKILTSPASAMAKIKKSDVGKNIWWSKMAEMLKEPSLLNIFDIYPQFLSDSIIHNLIDEKNLIVNNPQIQLINCLKNTPDQLNALLSADYQSTLTNDMLVKVDRASMANSLEGREPLLDHHLYEYMASIPSSQKMKGNTLKYLLKNITHKYIPKEMMERPKMGFGIPIGTWLRSDLRYIVEDCFDEATIKKYGILDCDYTQKLVTSLLNSPPQNNLLWLLVSFQMWCKKWL